MNSAGADSVLPFSSGISSYSSVYSTSNVSSASFTNAEIDKIYLIIGTIRWTDGGTISFSGFQEIFGTTKSVLSSGMAWWHGYYIKIVKATSTTINATFTKSSDKSKSALEIYKLS